jgi:hypothetical protein
MAEEATCQQPEWKTMYSAGSRLWGTLRENENMAAVLEAQLVVAESKVIDEVADFTWKAEKSGFRVRGGYRH